METYPPGLFTVHALCTWNNSSERCDQTVCSTSSPRLLHASPALSYLEKKKHFATVHDTCSRRICFEIFAKVLANRLKLVIGDIIDVDQSYCVPGRTIYDNLNLNQIEKILVQKALEKHKSNISKAAKELGLTRAALYRRLEKYDL